MMSWVANDKSEEQGERPEAAEKNQEGGSGGRIKEGRRSCELLGVSDAEI